MPYRLNEVLYEFFQQSSQNVVRVAAIDPVTNTEIVIVGDPNAGEATLKRVARQKLEYVLEKKFGSNTGEGSGGSQNRRGRRQNQDSLDVDA